MLISCLVRINIDSLAMNSTRRALAQGEPSDQALAQLEALILDEKAQPLLVTALNGERAMLIELIRRVERREVGLSKLIGGGTGYRMIAAVAGNIGRQRALTLEWMNEAVAISRRPTFEQGALFAKWDAKISALNQHVLKRFTAILALELLPAVRMASSAFLRSQAELGATAILIAAERQSRRTGKWPASIKEIDPSILPQAPVDPLSGEPFHFEHHDGQLIIYSIGLNGKDEHGAYDSKGWPNGASDDFGAKAWDVKLRRQPPVQAKPPGSSVEK